MQAMSTMRTTRAHTRGLRWLELGDLADVLPVLAEANQPARPRSRIDARREEQAQLGVPATRMPGTTPGARTQQT